MLSVISIGISKYPCTCNGKNLDISCAGHDAKKVFDVFKSIMGEEFLDHASICLRNITATEFVHLLDSLKFSFITDKDTMILYFSGHASNIKQYGNEQDFSLLFSDYNEELSNGYVSLMNEIIPLLNKICCNIVLILDCCYSGEGLRSATSIVGNHQISVISATSGRGLTGFTENGSELANALVDGIRDIKIHNKDFTLNTLQKSIQGRCPKSQINVAAGKSGEIYLKKVLNYEKIYYNLKEKFLWQIQNGDDKYREALWYSLSDIPEPIQVEILNEYFHCTNENSKFPVEVNWQVRRSIGSVISLFEDKNHRFGLVYRLIESGIWQEQCIGIIGARYDIKNNKNVYKKIIELVSEKVIKKIDAVWLANLYAADNLEYDYHRFLNTSLINNSWGIQEVYKTSQKHECDFEMFKSELEKAGISYQDGTQTIHCSEVCNTSQLYCIFNQKNERGRLPENSKAKFILSSLYGNWRGYKLVNCKGYFRNNLEQDIRRELLAAKDFPQVEYKMALFEYFITESELLKQYYNEVKWGLQDTHPWVRRTAIQAFKSAKLFIKECNDSIIKYIQEENENIGELDLYIQFAPEIGDMDSLVTALRKSKKYAEVDIEGVEAKFL